MEANMSAPESRTSAPAEPVAGQMGYLLERLRFVVAAASLLLALTTVATLAWAFALAFEFARELLDGGWRSSLLVANLLEVIDLVLIATVQILVAYGLWELFIGPLAVPEWARVKSLEQLKSSMSELIVLVIAIKFVEKLVQTPRALDVLYSAIGVSVVGLMLVALGLGKVAKAKSGGLSRSVSQE